MLTPENREKIQLSITQKISDTEIKILEYKELTKPIGPENAIGRVSRMDAINNRSVNEAALRTAENQLKKMKIALSKINEDKFGLCTSCGGEIQLGRIMLMPESNRCIGCAR